MKVKYCRKRRLVNLFFGSAWIILGIVEWRIKAYFSDFALLAFVISSLYIGNYFHKIYAPYFVIENGFIRKSYPFKDVIELSEVRAFHTNQYAILLCSELKTFEIPIYKVDKKSLNHIYKYLDAQAEKLNVPTSTKKLTSLHKIFLIGFFLMSLPFTINAQQKIKPLQNPVSWSYTIAPKSPLAEDMTTYDIIVDSHLNPMDWWDEMVWKAKLNAENHQDKDQAFQEAMSDTLNLWATKYLALKQRPYQKQAKNPDFTIVLNTEEYKVEKIQSNVDFSNPESALCEVHATARLTVTSRIGEILLDIPLTYYADEKQNSKWLHIRHILLNPILKMKYNLKRQPEKRRKLLNKKLATYEADVLEYFYRKSGQLLREHFLERQKTFYSATFGIKNKGHEALNDACDSAQKAINALSAQNKRKKKNYLEIQPEVEICISYWQDKLNRTENPQIQKYLMANLSLGHLLLGNLEESKMYLHQIPDYNHQDEKLIPQEGFEYYLQGLSEAIDTREQYGDLAQIR